jgi:opacity protein-like surface antigen
MRKKSILMLLILLNAVPAILYGQDKFGFELGGFVGGAFWKSKTFQIGPPQSPEPISFQLEYKDEIVGGVRANILSRGHWGGDLTYGYQRNNVTFNRQDNSLGPLTLNGSVQQFFYNQVYYITRYGKSAVTPYVTAGLGLEAYGLSDESRAFAADPLQGDIGTLKKTDTRFAYNFGAGIKAKLGSHLGIRFKAPELRVLGGYILSYFFRLGVLRILSIVVEDSKELKVKCGGRSLKKGPR